MPGCGRAYDAIALAEYGFDRSLAAKCGAVQDKGFCFRTWGVI